MTELKIPGYRFYINHKYDDIIELSIESFRDDKMSHHCMKISDFKLLVDFLSSVSKNKL